MPLFLCQITHKLNDNYSYMQNYIFSLFNTRLYYEKSTDKSTCGENVGKNQTSKKDK